MAKKRLRKKRRKQRLQARAPEQAARACSGAGPGASPLDARAAEPALTAAAPCELQQGSSKSLAGGDRRAPPSAAAPSVNQAPAGTPSDHPEARELEASDGGDEVASERVDEPTEQPHHRRRSARVRPVVNDERADLPPVAIDVSRPTSTAVHASQHRATSSAPATQSSVPAAAPPTPEARIAATTEAQPDAPPSDQAQPDAPPVSGSLRHALNATPGAEPRRWWRPAREAAQPPRFAVIKGLSFGALLIPAAGLATWLLAHLGIGSVRPLREHLALAVIFAGVPALVTGAGIGRAAARAALIPPHGRRRATLTAALASAVASAGLVLLAAIPVGGLPMNPASWAWIAFAGALVGALLGPALGWWITVQSRPREHSCPAHHPA